MNKLTTFALAASVTAGAAIAWRLADTNREPADQTAAIDARQATVARDLQRTLRESRAGIETPAIVAPSAAAAAPQNVLAQPATGGQAGVRSAPAPDGYALGTYHGLMQRAPSSGDAVPPPPRNPAWLDPADAPESILEQAREPGRDFTFAVLRLVPGTDQQAIERSLVSLGARVEGVSGQFVRVRVPAERDLLEPIAELSGVLGIGAVPTELKAEATFVEDLLSRSASEPVPVFITLMMADPAGEWRRALSGLGVVVGAYDPGLRSYTANLPASTLMRVLAADFVMTVEPVPVVAADHASSVPVMGVDGFRSYDAALEHFTGITGAGIAVGVLDTGLNAQHMDIATGRRSICGANFVADENWDLWMDLDGHGTHVFGTVAGAGATDPVLAGVAPGVSHLRFGKVLSAHGFGSSEDIRRGMDYLSRRSSCPQRRGLSEAARPVIVNMSLSASDLIFSGRGVGERKLDSVVYAHSQLYVVAQANSGQHGFSNYGTAKNSLAVGAIEDSGLIAGFSSHGPTADGRLSPGVVGTGVSLTSARGMGSLTGHYTASGTSMASPSVAGLAALLMEARPEFQHNPALTRARLMASAVRPRAYLESRAHLPADNSDGPGAFNNRYGLGLVSARTSLFSRDDPEGWLIGSAIARPENGTYEYIDIEVPEGASRLDVVLTWDEAPADTLTRSVFNNLDLYADRGADCGDDACGEYASRSAVDNVEWLLIENPEPGVHRIKVVPVEVYGEPVSAAVAWTILRGESDPRLDVNVEVRSPADAGGAYFAVDVTVDSSGYVASGTTIHLNCRTQQDGADCFGDLNDAFLPQHSRVDRGDGLSSTLEGHLGYYSGEVGGHVSIPFPVGEVASSAPKHVQLRFLREAVPYGSVLDVTATSWNATSAGRTVELDMEGLWTVEDDVATANDSFSSSEIISGASGETQIDLGLASREPGEPLDHATERSAWYAWDAPAKGLYRFRVREAESGKPASVDFALFTGEKLVELELEAAKKSGSEIAFSARSGTRYALRIGDGAFQRTALVLQWEAADARPAHDDFAFAHVIDGERGSTESTNEGATLERQEFWGGYAATVWYAWTAPADGYVEFEVDNRALKILAFSGKDIGELRLVTESRGWRSSGSSHWILAAFAIKRGETYRIAVGSADADASGSPFTLSWEIAGDDPMLDDRCNDRFQDAIVIDGPDGAVLNPFDCNDSNARFTVEPLEPLATGVATGWWRWTAPRDGRFTWRMDGSDAFQLSFFRGVALENLESIGVLRGGSSLVLDAIRETQYWIALGRSGNLGRSRGSPSRFSWGMTPENDNRANAIPIQDAAGSVSAALIHATAEAGEPRNVVGLESVWWNWTAPGTGWYRFSVDGNPLHAIVSVYGAGDSGAAFPQAIGDSERSFLANGRVDVRVFVREGERFDIRLSRRPGVGLTDSDRLVWAPTEAPAYLSYKGAFTEESLISNPLFDGSWSPRHLAATDDGMYLFSISEGQLHGFVRDGESGELALVYLASAESNRDTLDPDTLRPDSHTLWWSPQNETLFALDWCDPSYSFALPDAGTTLDVRRIEGIEFTGSPRCGNFAAQGDHGGSHLYAIEEYENRLLVIRADSPTSLTHVQTVAASAASGDDRTVVPNIIRPMDLALAPDGRHLYLADELGLFVFSRDSSSGRLAPVGEVTPSNDQGDPFYKMRSLRHATIDASGTVLFVTGFHSEDSVTNTAVAAFDISADPSNPAHLDTLTGFHFHEADRGTLNAWNHLQLGPNAFSSCDKPIAHGELAAVDVFCTRGYFVVQWNPEGSALEVTDFAVSGDRDRFGNVVPVLGWQDRKMAQSPDGAHAYRTTSLQIQSSAIHIFQRGGAMLADDETAPPTGGATDASPSFAPGSGPGDRSYTVGTAIATLALPEATGGNGPLTYSLSPTVPGLTFNATARRLSGTPSTAGTYDMTYRVRDVDGDTDTLTSTITVMEPSGPSDDYTPLEGLRVSPGRIQYQFFSTGGCIQLTNTTLNGVTYSVHSSKWQRRDDADSPWMDVAGTEQTGAVCALDPTETGEYRLVGEISIDGTRGRYSSENTIIVP